MNNMQLEIYDILNYYNSSINSQDSVRYLLVEVLECYVKYYDFTSNNTGTKLDNDVLEKYGVSVIIISKFRQFRNRLVHGKYLVIDLEDNCYYDLDAVKLDIKNIVSTWEEDLCNM